MKRTPQKRDFMLAFQQLVNIRYAEWLKRRGFSDDYVIKFGKRK